MTAQRMFLAVMLPPEVIDSISDLPTKALRGVRYTTRRQWHITLRFLGECERAAALPALERIDAVAPMVTLGPAVSLLGSRIVMLPVLGLDELGASAAAAFAGIGEPPPDRPFDAHLTIARLKGAPMRDPSLVSVLGAPYSATFPAASVALLATELHPDGAQYSVIAEHPLA